MELNDKQTMLFEFVKTKHKDQKRKYTGEPYFNHLYNVAKIVSIHEMGCIEIALCHDLFEDTDCTFNELYKKLTDIGYDRKTSYDICSCVNELTDVFTSEEYPYLNRVKRKENEANRLGKISRISQTVKYADLIDNTSSITEHDKDFSKVYLKEKEAILKVMNQGNQILFTMCKKVLEKALT
jgi:(p)ppGpp synthase/HD superfamily hydrolase